MTAHKGRKRAARTLLILALLVMGLALATGQDARAEAGTSYGSQSDGASGSSGADAAGDTDNADSADQTGETDNTDGTTTIDDTEVPQSKSPFGMPAWFWLVFSVCASALITAVMYKVDRRRV